MRYRKQGLGRVAVFLLPSLKLKDRRSGASPVEEAVHGFLMEHFGGYTAAAGNIFGYWKDDSGQESYGEHRQFQVGLVDEGKLPVLKSFLARIAAEIGEQCVYLESAGETSLIYPDPTP